jgi:hypothetical protein
VTSDNGRLAETDAVAAVHVTAATVQAAVIVMNVVEGGLAVVAMAGVIVIHDVTVEMRHPAVIAVVVVGIGAVPNQNRPCLSRQPLLKLSFECQTSFRTCYKRRRLGSCLVLAPP